MCTILKVILSFVVFFAFLPERGNAQTHCKEIDLFRKKGQWTSRPAGVGSQWKTLAPLRKELQRVFPQAPDGIFAVNSLAYNTGNRVLDMPSAPRVYRSYIMIKDYECIMHPQPIVQPEGETGCWIYFSVNDPDGNIVLPFTSEITFGPGNSALYHTDMWLDTDAHGNKIWYISNNKEQVTRQGYFFSARERLPFRKLIRRELYEAYTQHHEKRIKGEVSRFEKVLAKEQKEYDRLSPNEKREQSFRLLAIDGAKKSLAFYQDQLNKYNNWITTKLPHLSHPDDTAYATAIMEREFEPEKLDAPPGEGYPVWIQDVNFYDRNKPADDPQCIFLWYRRQDQDPPKKNFIEKFETEFNLDVLWKLAGASPRRDGLANTIRASVSDVKTLTKNQQEQTGTVTFHFDNTPEGQYPNDWQGMRNITVQKHRDTKWLAMTKDGYWFPRQYNKEIGDGFSLSFDLCWPEKISYYSGLFTVTLCEMEYDNAGERYHIDENRRNYWSFYDSYAGEFNRISLWFDPYWNNGGTLEVYVMDSGENRLFTTRISLPDFAQTKNMHSLTISRKGNALVVTDNGKKIADLPGIFPPGVRYNLYTFSRYKGNKSENKEDVFYINNTKVSY